MSSRSLKRTLADVASDLWGAPESPVQPAPQAEGKTYQSTFPPFEQLWQTADEAVDWTEALAHDKPTDGLTSPETWSLLHKHAAAVLSGDVTAYLEVLRAVNPLGDLGVYAAAFHVETTSTDRLSVTLTASPAYMTQDASENRRYLCAVALRAARDLMALLPVSEVAVAATYEGQPLLHVVFDRGELQKVRFSFIDPVDFALRCGAVFEEVEV